MSKRKSKSAPYLARAYVVVSLVDPSLADGPCCGCQPLWPLYWTSFTVVVGPPVRATAGKRLCNSQNEIIKFKFLRSNLFPNE